MREGEGNQEGRARESEREGEKYNHIPRTYSPHYQREGANRSIIGCRHRLIFLPVSSDFCSVLLRLLLMELISC